MAPEIVDFSLYLVTDSTPAILGDRDLVSVVEAAISGGVTIVQLRDKTSETSELIRTAKRLHEVTATARVPLLINDRIDVALAVGAEGVHIGQDDIDLESARRILGPDAIIGVTVNNIDEALAAANGGADYLGIGTVFATATKDNTKSIIGTSGLKSILAALAQNNANVKTVCIGGINSSNLQRVVFQSTTQQKRLDGIAVVSAIMASLQPRDAAIELRRLLDTPPPFASLHNRSLITHATLVEQAPRLVAGLARKKPLCHNMTNLVVQNFAANVALAVGASPIMSNNAHEAADLASLGGSLVINMGTTTPDMRQNHVEALKAYNEVGGPVVFDPVGAGATRERRDGVKALMAAGYFDVIKGNEGEIRTIAGSSGVRQHGVDSGASQLTLEQKLELVKTTAARERNVVVMTGAADVVSDGIRTLVISNGHELLGEITGSGCSLGTTIASFLAVERCDKLLATAAAILFYNIAAERAASWSHVRGPGSFVPTFLDELYTMRQESVNNNSSWTSQAKFEVL